MSPFRLPDQMIRDYIKRRAQDLARCQEALASQQFDPIRMVGHQIKGNALTFGFPELEGVGKDLEEAAEQGDLAKIAQSLTQYEAWLSSQPASL